MSRRKTKSPFAELFSVFCVLFPDDDFCKKTLGEQRLKSAGPCPKCQGTKFSHSESYKNYYCQACGKEFFTFAGSFFDSVTHFRARVGAIWFYTQHIRPSANEFAKLFCIAISTAQDILDSVGFLLLEKMVQENTGLLSSNEFIELYGCRSTETPAREHPCAEQILLDRHFEQPGAAANELLSAENDSHELTVLENLSSDRGTSVDELIEKTSIELVDVLTALGKLEFKGLVESTADRLFKRKKKKSKAIDNEYLKSFAEKFKLAVQEAWHRISRKYVQIYVAKVWATQKENEWTDDLIFEFLNHEPVPRELMRTYVSPYLLQVAVIPA